MELVTYALVSLDNTKTFLNVSNNTQDEKIKMLINMATDYIESQTGRRFTSTVHTNETFDGTGTRQLNLKSFPLVSFTKLEINNTANNSDSWTTIDSDNYWVDLETGIVTKTSSFTDFSDTGDEEVLSDTPFQRGKSKYRSTYTSGYSIVPYDLQFATMTIVGQLMASSAGGGGSIKSESLGDHSVTYQDITEINGGGNGGILEDVLSKYRDIPLVN